MTKNMTRKGLALGAAFALTATGLVATPAYAADLSLAASAGSTYNVFLSDTFTLNSAITGNTNIANTTAWKWEVVNTSGVAVGVAGQWYSTDLTQDGATTPPASDTGYGDSGLTTTDTTTTKVYVPAAGKVTTDIGFVNTITLDPTTISTTDTFSVTVRSFSDLDGSGSVTAGDLVSDSQTITFHKGSEVTGTVTMDALNAGVAATATLTFDKGINYEMITLANVTKDFTVNGAAAGSGAVTGLNTAKDGIVLTGASAAAGQIISAKGLWKGYDGDSTLTSATSATSTVSAASAATTAKATIANNENVTTGSATVTGGTVNISKTLRSGTTELSYTATFKKDATTALAAVSPVTVTITEVGTTMVVGDNVTVNGKKLTGTAGSADAATLYTSTDATGNLVINVTAANAKALDNIVILATSGSGSVKVDLAWADAAIDDVYVTNELANDTVRTVAKGGSTALNYVVVDQFDKPWTKTDYSYRLQFAATGTATAPAALNLSNGSATLNYTDNSTAASGAYTLTATLYSQTGVGAWTTATANHVASFNIVAAIAAPSAISTATALLDDASAIAAGGVPLADADLAALDNRVYNNANAALGVTAGYGAKLVATVTSATGANVQGAAVTVSAAGLYFSTTAGGSGVVSKDSIVLNTTSAGVATVYVYGQVSGKHTITFTSGSATKTQDVTWAAAAANTGDALTISAAASAMPGTTFKVTGKLVDEYGNGVQIATAGTGANPTLVVGYAGPGLVSGSLPTTTSAAGEFSFYVLLGANDSGSAVVTASYDADGTTVTLSAIAASATVVVGTAGNVGVLASWTKNLNDGTVKMYAKNIVGAGKVQFMLNGEEIAWVNATSAADSKLRTANGASYLVRTVDLVEGQKNVLEIWVDGVRTARSAYSY